MQRDNKHGLVREPIKAEIILVHKQRMRVQHKISLHQPPILTQYLVHRAPENNPILVTLLQVVPRSITVLLPFLNQLWQHALKVKLMALKDLLVIIVPKSIIVVLVVARLERRNQLQTFLLHEGRVVTGTTVLLQFAVVVVVWGVVIGVLGLVVDVIAGFEPGNTRAVVSLRIDQTVFFGLAGVLDDIAEQPVFVLHW